MRVVFFACLIIFALRFHLPSQLSDQDFITTGTIGSLAEIHQHNIQFLFIIHNINHNTHHISKKIWLSWYAPPPVHLHVGDEWQLHIRIKPTQKNWLLSNNINAMGTVKFDLKNQLIQRHRWDYPIEHLRELIYTRLKNTLTPELGLGFISALTVGMRDHITENQWDDLRGTGTNHLMAIAGLHIGFVSGMGYFLLDFLWRRFSVLMLWMPAQEAATIQTRIINRTIE